MSEPLEVPRFPHGAEWRKWDLHMHSDASDGHMTCDEIVRAAVSQGLSVIALTDHHTARNIDRIREAGRMAGLTVIAGIEFRTEYGSRSVHLIGLFPERHGEYVLDSKTLQSLVLDALELSEARISAEGAKYLRQSGAAKAAKADTFKAGLPCVQVSFKAAATIIHKYGGLVIPHAGSKENSIDREVRHEGKAGVTLYESLGPLKEELFQEGFIDICEVRKQSDDEAFYLHKFGRPSITCSDAHRAEQVGSEFTWVKADPTFEGLRQMVKEPASRVFLGDRPDLLRRLEAAPTKFIRHLAVEPAEDYDGANGKWFDHVDIDFNPELVAIIGNKGSGKSAVVDIVGLCADYALSDRYSFLTPTRFRQKGYADSFRARIGWASGDSTAYRDLMTDADTTRQASVKYLPQGYFEELCNDPEGIELLKKEINEVVFQHVPRELKLDQPTFEGFLREKSAAAAKAISRARLRLRTQNDGVAQLEKKRHARYRKTLENALAQKERELKSLRRPQAVRNPARDGSLREQQKGVQQGILDIKRTVSDLNARIRSARDARGRLDGQIHGLRQFRQEMTERAAELRKFIAEQRRALSRIPEIRLDDVVKFELHMGSVDKALEQRRKSMAEIEPALSETSVPDKDGHETSLIVQKASAEESLKRLKAKLDRPGKAYQDYLESLKSWRAERADIKGRRDAPGTLECLKAELLYLDTHLDRDVTKARDERNSTVREIYRHKREIIAVYGGVQEHLGDVLREQSDRMSGYPVRIVAEVFVRPEFRDRILGYVNKTVLGNYKGVQEAQKYLGSLLERFDVNSEDQLMEMLQAIVASLEVETRSGGAIPRDIDDQVEDLEGFYDYLFGLEYLGENYQLRLGDKPLDRLSPGEKGALLLVFYLLLDRSDVPLILDQPEDNLDNESVYQILVPFIREAKKRRQILMITHNPNLAVVADAEQVIRVDIRKDGENEFSYVSGSIESPYMKQAVVDVLEGTMPAFRNRSRKYAE